MIDYKSDEYKRLVLLDRGRRYEFRDLSQQEFLFLCHILSKIYNNRMEYAAHDTQEWIMRVTQA